MAKTSTQSKPQDLVEKLKGQPKSLVGQLRTLVPLIDDLKNEGHTIAQVMEALRKTGMVFTDSSFLTSLKRARRSVRAGLAAAEQNSQPLNTKDKGPSTQSPVGSHPLVVSPNDKAETETRTTPAFSRVVRPQPNPTTTHKKDPSNDDFL